MMPLLIPYCRLIYALLVEKEIRIKETMKIMGLTDAAYFMSWIIQYGSILTAVVFFVTILLKATVATYSNFFLLFMWHWSYAMTFMGKAFLLA